MNNLIRLRKGHFKIFGIFRRKSNYKLLCIRNKNWKISYDSNKRCNKRNFIQKLISDFNVIATQLVISIPFLFLNFFIQKQIGIIKILFFHKCDKQINLTRTCELKGKKIINVTKHLRWTDKQKQMHRNGTELPKHCLVNKRKYVHSYSRSIRISLCIFQTLKIK